MKEVNKSTKICFVSLKAYPLFNPEIKSTFGGAEVQLTLLSKELAKKKELDIYFIVADYGQEEKETYDGVKVWKGLNFKDNKLKQVLDFFKIFNKVNADVYVQRTLTVESGLIALYCKLRKKKFVYMVAHDSEADGTHRLYGSKLKGYIASLVFKYAGIVFVQNEYQNSNLRNNIGGSRLITLSSSWLSSHNETEISKDIILWVGRSESWKRPEIFINLAQRFPKEYFVMICPEATDSPDYFIEIKKKADRIKNLKFIDFVPFDKIDNYFKKAKIYVITSEKEGFANSLIQATREGTPILSLKVNPNNFIDKHECGFVCNDSQEVLEKKCERLLRDKNLYDRLSVNAKEYFVKTHDITVNANKFLKYINER